MFRINARRDGDVMILDLKGTIAAGSAEIDLNERVRSLLSRGCRNVVLNLAEARSTGSSGVSALLGTLLAAREVGGEVRLVNVEGGLTDLLVIVALHTYFVVCESEEDAVASFHSAVPALAVNTVAAKASPPSKVVAA